MSYISLLCTWILPKIGLFSRLYLELTLDQWVQHRHPYEDVRDTSLYYPLRQSVGIDREGEYPSLKKLYAKAFGEEVQTGIHCPVRSLSLDIKIRCADDIQVEDARAAMRLFMSVREPYEASLAKGEECVAGMPRCV